MKTASIVRGPEGPILDITVGDMIAGMAACFPERDALISRHQDVRLSWSEFDQEIDRTARGLVGLGLEPFDRVGVWSANCVEWVLLQMACAKAGFILVSMNPTYRATELAFALKKSRVKALFLWDHDARSNYAQILREATRGQDLPLKHVTWMGTNSWMGMLTNSKNVPAWDQSATDPVSVQYTSGTTGRPKGVVLTHRNLVNNAWRLSAWLGITEQDRVCNPCSLAHYTGMINGIASLIRGAALILPSPEFDAQALFESIHEERATVLGGPPAIYHAQLSHPDLAAFDTSSLRVAWIGGAPCPPDLVRQAKEKMRIGRIEVGYGQTESAAMLTIGDMPCVMANTEMKIVEPGTGKIMQLEVPGELCIRGDSVMLGYDDDPEATRQAIDSEGWLHTSDLATLNSAGHLQIVGRVPNKARAKAATREERHASTTAASASR